MDAHQNDSNLDPCKLTPSPRKPFMHDSSWSPLYAAAITEACNNAARCADVLHRAREESSILAESLISQEPDRRALLVRNSRRFQSWSLAERLVEESRARSENGDPGEGCRLAELAVEILERHIPDDDPDKRLPFFLDLHARAYACLADAEARSGRSGQASADFQRALSLLEGGSGDPLEKAHALRLFARFLSEAGEEGNAARHLRQAVALYLATAEARQALEATETLADLEEGRGHPIAARQTLERTLRSAVLASRPRLSVRLLEKLFRLYRRSGMSREAWALLPRLRRRARETEDHAAWLQRLSRLLRPPTPASPAPAEG